MNENKNILKLVIPVVAIIVIFESVVLVNDLLKKKEAVTQGTGVNQMVVDVTNNKPVLDLIFGTESKQMVVGKTYPVELNMLANTIKSVDSMSLYINFDQTAFEVTNLTFDNRLPKPSFSKISTQKNLIVVNYFVQDQSGYKIILNNTVALARFNVKPKKVGSFNFEINTGIADKESATMFIENATGKVLPFSSNKLTVTNSAK